MFTPAEPSEVRPDRPKSEPLKGFRTFRTPDGKPLRTFRTQNGRVSDAIRTPTQAEQTALSRLLHLMAARWEYSPDELAAVLADAHEHPGPWLAIVEADEALGLTAADFQDRDPDREKPTLSTIGETRMLTVSAESSASFEMPPAGPVAARCCRLIDLGSQESEYQGEKKMQRKILISWELAETRADGTPHQISRRFGLSLHEKATLRQFLQAWRGRPFSDEELAGFDLRKLLNAPCLLNVTHTSRNGKDYANIASITPLPKGMTAPDLSAAPVVFDIDAPDAPDLMVSLSENLQATIAASPEWQARIKAGATGPGFDDLESDDIAF